MEQMCYHGIDHDPMHNKCKHGYHGKQNEECNGLSHDNKAWYLENKICIAIILLAIIISQIYMYIEVRTLNHISKTQQNRINLLENYFKEFINLPSEHDSFNDINEDIFNSDVLGNSFHRSKREIENNGYEEVNGPGSSEDNESPKPRDDTNRRKKNRGKKRDRKSGKGKSNRRKNKNKHGNNKKRHMDSKDKRRRKRKEEQQPKYTTPEMHTSPTAPINTSSSIVSNQMPESKAFHVVIDKDFWSEHKKTPHLKTEEGKIIQSWKVPATGFNYEQQFAALNGNGSISVLQDGLYLVYSQVSYFDRTGRWSHVIDISNKPLAKCLATEWGIEIDPYTSKYYNTVHQCYTAAVDFIRKGQVISIVSKYGDRTIHGDEDMSFWGLIKL